MVLAVSLLCDIIKLAPLSLPFYLHLCEFAYLPFHEFSTRARNNKKKEMVRFVCGLVFSLFFDDNKTFFRCLLLSHGNTWTTHGRVITIIMDNVVGHTDLVFRVWCACYAMWFRDSLSFLLTCDLWWWHLSAETRTSSQKSSYFKPSSSRNNDYSLSVNEWVPCVPVSFFVCFSIWVHSCGDNVMLAKGALLPRLFCLQDWHFDLVL